ncbi:GspE/PulE family protein [Celeribacter baekdonensis]|uniref:GspE/PulE family protein n=1 Tax=Celeribacter baekdonensis TaxID=875171 RepID=UPI0030D6D605
MLQPLEQENFDEVGFLDFLVERQKLNQSDANRVRHASSVANAAVELSVLELGLLGEDVLYQELACFAGLSLVAPAVVQLELLDNLSLPLDFLHRAEAVPVENEDGYLFLATTSPRSHELIDAVAFRLDRPVSPALITPTDLKSLLNERIAPETQVVTSDEDVARLLSLANDGPIIKITNDLIAQAVTDGASDIHIEAGPTSGCVRCRVDGVLSVMRTLPEEMRATVVSRLKVMAGLNISERRQPQDGRLRVPVRGRQIDIRFSTLPTQFGESAVLRLLDRGSLTLDWRSLGYENDRVQEILKIIHQPNGIFLVAGPTGSGKTTTLYTALSELTSDEKKIITVEDPVEYAIEGINQVQVDPAIDMSFSRALRAILRQDPDVILVGEIRDEETAGIAVRAALVGRLVLSTIHTNDALAAVTRLRDLGVPPYLLSATLRGVLSQRLVRRMCSACAGKGCDVCDQKGTKGRRVVSEFLRCDGFVSEAIARDSDLAELEAAARKVGFRTIREDAEKLVASGQIDQNETLRVLGQDT